ncbi:MAG: C4-dicarboxylate ABC transporter permease [Alphaproteobacteria bacterium MedPE-SWcel]|nr:MAG: C4-dicarboxylate ABC transporter permease [Alphaproteobacteria bacterium MedPE-SWcel]
MLNRVERIFVDVAAMAIILLGLLIFADVVALNVFAAPLPDTIIIVRELMVIAIVLPLAAATVSRAHIAVEFVTNFLPARVVNWFVVFGSLFALLALSPLVYAGTKDLLHQWHTGSVFYGDLGLPQWPGRLAFVVGIGLTWVRLLVMVVADAATAIRGGEITFGGH